MPHARLRFFVTPVGSLMVLAASLVAYVVVTLRGAEPFSMIDLRVYHESARHVWDNATLYTFESSALGLRFTYPPFAAVLFTAVAWLPWAACRVLWQLASIAAIAAICLFTQQLTGAPSTRQTLCRAALLTAAAVWMEPVRSTLNYGQVNLFLAAALLGGLAAGRTWLTGASVGLATAVKLVPGITTLYYLLTGRRRVVFAAAATFAATVLISYAIAPHLTIQFFTATVFDPARAGDVDAVNNQSLRGALARILRRDNLIVWGAAAVLTVVGGVAAARACLRNDDRLGAFLVTQFVGLLVSPISWNHHWIWVLPLLIWAETGPLHRDRIINTLSTIWALAVVSFAVSIQIALHDSTFGTASSAWGQALYPVLGVLTIAAVWRAHTLCSSQHVATDEQLATGPPT